MLSITCTRWVDVQECLRMGKISCRAAAAHHKSDRKDIYEQPVCCWTCHYCILHLEHKLLWIYIPGCLLHKPISGNNILNYAKFLVEQCVWVSPAVTLMVQPYLDDSFDTIIYTRSSVRSDCWFIHPPHRADTLTGACSNSRLPPSFICLLCNSLTSVLFTFTFSPLLCAHCLLSFLHCSWFPLNSVTKHPISPPHFYSSCRSWKYSCWVLDFQSHSSHVLWALREIVLILPVVYLYLNPQRSNVKTFNQFFSPKQWNKSLNLNDSSSDIFDSMFLHVFIHFMSCFYKILWHSRFYLRVCIVRSIILLLQTGAIFFLDPTYTFEN